jgi:hypothetical protein
LLIQPTRLLLLLLLLLQEALKLCAELLQRHGAAPAPALGPQLQPDCHGGNTAHRTHRLR